MLAKFALRLPRADSCYLSTITILDQHKLLEAHSFLLEKGNEKKRTLKNWPFRIDICLICNAVALSCFMLWANHGEMPRENLGGLGSRKASTRDFLPVQVMCKRVAWHVARSCI
ncbi:hypothetical protein MPTK1_2g20810 [Marchantia polymorpha subsp. ruderalis]|uniref:Uncharacterized protein n=1 Tax=Marchantia polymorpha TaxID=3197 RepID=A0A2R6X2Y7_MARPO|nr:hypothetical protein MARPO_0040s0131 [Marchantia polymorpha]BBN03106.1 hypothetical protein Mp_2g20810 [Marchantia polymorpha subsp. ruderalis]|eukprot:PTQ40469.1 hypothetical protein MARPO_0040s0131 [Marchantia polymorpha]